MHRLGGGCHCGNIVVQVDLPRPANTYEPRTCDCDFCVAHGASYVSDPEGTLNLRIQDGADCHPYRQGSGVAAFLICKRCGVLAAVLYRTDERLYAAVTTNVLNDRTDFGPTKSVSPKKLSSAEKTGRWQELWFPRVNLVIDRGEISG